MAVCHSFCIYFSLYNTVDTFIQSFIHNIRRGPSPYLHSCRLSGRNLHGVPSRDSNSGLPYSKPARYQLSHAAICTLQSCRLPDSASRGVVFGLRISPRIQSQNRNGSKRSVRDICQTSLCKNPRKSTLLLCPFKYG